MERIVYRTCTLCEACCGIEVHVEGTRVSAIRGDRLDPASRGYVCAKAAALADLHADPDRLRHPVERTASGWSRISWREALSRSAEGILEAQRRHGRDAAAIYLGEPLVHNFAGTLYTDELVAAVGGRKRFSANSLDQFPKQLVSHWMYGSGLFLSVPDIDRTDYLLIIGADPLVSNGSLMTAPDVRRRLALIRERAGRVVVVDPRRSRTAQRADEHHFIRPGSDGLFAAALLNTVFSEGRMDRAVIEPLGFGLESVEGAVAGFSPEVVETRVGIAAQTIRSLARAFCDAPSAVCYGRMGTSTVRFGTTTSWLIELLNIVTGNLDRAGGAMFPNPPVDMLRLAGDTQRGRWHSSSRGTPEFMGELPTATLAEEIEASATEGVRALLTVAGNPVLSAPGGSKLGEALSKLDFMVSVDFYRNETTQHANLILPPVGPLERDHFDLVFQLFSVRKVPRWSPAVFERTPESRSDAEIMLDIAARLRWGRGGAGRAIAVAEKMLVRLGAERCARLFLDLALRFGPDGAGLRFWKAGLTLPRLREAQHGIDLGPLEPCLPQRIPRKTKHIDLAPPELIEDLERLRASLNESVPVLLLVGRRQPRTLNSWSHNLPRLVTGPKRCILHMHPHDAAARGIADGASVSVTSRVGRIEVPVRLGEDIMPGVVSLPHGYGHTGEGLGLSVAVRHAGASLNDLTDPGEIDPLSGNAVLSGVPVSVEQSEPHPSERPEP